MSNRVDLVTVWRGRDSATYLLSDWEKLGDKAEPLYVEQSPTKNGPFHKIDMTDVDGFYKHTALTKEEILTDSSGKWDIAALKKLTSPNQNQLDALKKDK
jgi:hypothetical protein